ncbi:hypothetical protein J6590_026742 [Homalodisca vitripennis]|nr:hypothetical protein J6590_026742 [Homalodisca vitripennis]
MTSNAATQLHNQFHNQQKAVCYCTMVFVIIEGHSYTESGLPQVADLRPVLCPLDRDASNRATSELLPTTPGEMHVLTAGTSLVLVVRPCHSNPTETHERRRATLLAIN